MLWDYLEVRRAGLQQSGGDRDGKAGRTQCRNTIKCPDMWTVHDTRHTQVSCTYSRLPQRLPPASCIPEVPPPAPPTPWSCHSSQGVSFENEILVIENDAGSIIDSKPRLITSFKFSFFKSVSGHESVKNAK